MSYSLYTVYIPASPEAEKELGILPGSAIVGALGLPDPDLITVYYEGNKYGASNMHRFPNRVAQAAGRLRQRYPTVARQFGIEPSKLRAVATYNVDTREMDFGHEDHSVNENGESVLGGEAAENILALGDWIGRYHERE